MLENKKDEEVYNLIKNIDWNDKIEIGLLEIQIDLVFKKCEFEKAIVCCEKYIKATDNNEEAYNILSVSYMNLGNFDTAKTWFINSIQKYPNSITLHYNLAICYYMVKNYGNALKEIDKVIQIRQDDKYLNFRNDLLRLIKEASEE